MRACHRTLLAGLTAALLLSAAAGFASANRFSLNESRFRIAWRSLEFAYFEEELLFLGPLQCAVTLEGSFHSTLVSKVRGSLIAQVTRGAVGTCTGGSLTILAAGLPWALDYRDFTGTLPRIFTVLTQFIGAAFQTTIAGITCLATSSAARPGGWIWHREESEVLLNVTGDPGILLPVTGMGCATFRLGMEGNGTITKAGSTATLNMRLI